MYILLVFIFMLGFFERFAPGAFASDLMVEFKITGATLGSITAVYFVTYTALQIPAGVLADRVGPKKIVSTGAIIAGLGSLIFSLSPTLALISFGRFLVGLGGATVFIGIMKFNTQWFNKKNYGMISGVTLLLGNLGAAISAGPLAVLLSYVTWRNTFLTTGVTAISLGILIYLFVENSPKDAGFNQNMNDSRTEGMKEKWYKELIQVFLNKDIWPIFIASIGTNATFYAFAGLWGIPLLTDSFDLSNKQASLNTTIGLTAYGFFSLVIGWWSDKAGTRKPFVIGSSLISALGWLGLIILPWQPGWSGILLYLMIGLAAAQMVVSFAVVKEVVPSWVAGMALALVNTGVFLAVSLIQPLFGLMIDLSWSGAWMDGARQYSFENYRSGLWLTFAISFAGLIASFFVTETYCGEKEVRDIQKKASSI
ncbi:MFS transporter [Halobacillus naozhouensis]|uniref:Lysosomal dipeptide transporter MFSD1 n=2 Tax=Halobacillus naozhouensis TaxID=554880 RepID=A0ABY8IVI1_9BACI|nr:MFS transporter [Halobacillus naozhouensis]WFT74189.1 MFS transporter [Halobacillus naozhouensis]